MRASHQRARSGEQTVCVQKVIFISIDSAACADELRPGDPCPQCADDVLDYDPLLRLVCPRCGFFAAGGGYS